ncbi:homoserine acetyltransferase family protein, partial [Zalerion maritima]
DPDDVLVMMRTWQLGDISASREFGHDIGRALANIKCIVMVAPSETDLYVPPEDSEKEVKAMGMGPARLEVVPSIWGRWAGGDGSLDDWKFLDEKMGNLFLGEV